MSAQKSTKRPRGSDILSKDREPLNSESEGDEQHDHNAEASSSTPAITSSTKSEGLSHKKSKRSKTKVPGIIYISRIPPGMTPQKVKHLMGRWGEVGKVYAQRKDAPVQSDPSKQPMKARHAGANFSEAWVEFLDKNIAKTVASMLNAQVIGGKKGDRWRDDIWTMKYLSGFKWEMLGEQVAYERQAHTSRLRAEITRSRTEQSEYLKNVELARVLDKRRARKSAQNRETFKDTDDGRLDTGKVASSDETGEAGKKGLSKGYRQRQVVESGMKKGEGVSGMGDILGSVFG